MMNFEQLYREMDEKQEVKLSTKTLLFVYGSLRKGMYNHYLLERNSLQIATARIKGFSLYSLGSYPAIQECDDEDSFVCGEIYDVGSLRTYEQIDMMELGARYSRKMVKAVDIAGNEYDVLTYVFPKERDMSFNNKVMHGDWVLFVKGMRGKDERRT